MGQRIEERMSALRLARTPFVQATVVRAQAPTSVRPGDEAIVLGDGTLEGFVGGQCTQNSVRSAALAALADGNATLLRVLPDGAAEFPSTPGAQVVVNPCLSGGAIEVFLEPVLPPAIIAVTGATPIAEALRSAITFLGYAPAPAAGEDETIRTASDLAGCAAVILASHGPGELETLRAALDAGAPYIGVVASKRRAAGLFDELGLSAAERRGVHSPAGLWIGARTAPEIALSIMAEVVASVRGSERAAGGSTTSNAQRPDSSVTRAMSGPSGGSGPASSDRAMTPMQATDPVCGMSVTVMPDTPHLSVDGEDFYFCNPGCRRQFARERGVAL